MKLSAINTRFSGKNVFAVAKISTSMREIIPDFFYPFFSFLSFFNFDMTKWFCRVTCFVNLNDGELITSYLKFELHHFL